MFAQRANETADEDEFVADNYALLKESGLVEAGVPARAWRRRRRRRRARRDAAHARLSLRLDRARVLHAHPPGRDSGLALDASEGRGAVEPLLKRIAKERIILLSSGGSDWIGGSGKAEKVEGGYRITARKVFTSGAPAGDLLMTGAVLESEGEPPMVLHFGMPMNSPHVKVLDTWRTLGMRGTGSHDMQIDGHVVPEAAVPARRKAGEWHPLFQIIATIAFPLIYSVYLGVAESARDIAIGLAKRKQPNHHVVDARRPDGDRAGGRAAGARVDAGGRAAQRAVGRDRQSGDDRHGNSSARHAIAAVELRDGACRRRRLLSGGGLERRFRDIQAARYHPLQSGPQAEYAGAMALGLPVDRIF